MSRKNDDDKKFPNLIKYIVVACTIVAFMLYLGKFN